jgi:hypothetical protein
LNVRLNTAFLEPFSRPRDVITDRESKAELIRKREFTDRKRSASSPFAHYDSQTMLFCKVNDDFRAAYRVSVYENYRLAMKLLPTMALC